MATVLAISHAWTVLACPIASPIVMARIAEPTVAADSVVRVPKAHTVSKVCVWMIAHPIAAARIAAATAAEARVASVGAGLSAPTAIVLPSIAKAIPKTIVAVSMEILVRLPAMGFVIVMESAAGMCLIVNQTVTGVCAIRATMGIAACKVSFAPTTSLIQTLYLSAFPRVRRPAIVQTASIATWGRAAASVGLSLNPTT